MIIVTGGAGFIGSNLVRALNARGREDLLVVDNLKNGAKYSNLADCAIQDYRDKAAFLTLAVVGEDLPERVDAVFHQGACTETTRWDGRYMMQNNFEYSKVLLHWCLARQVPFIYASSAAVYGAADGAFRVDPACEAPLNVYGYSKLLFDQYVRRSLPGASSQVAGLRYFNVYGPGEQHKGDMASVAFHFNDQALREGQVRLFEGTDGYGHGEQRRDFIHVSDVVAVNLWFLDHPDRTGIFNVGTGRSQSFNAVARAVVGWHGSAQIRYIPFPGHLQGHYQSFTEADIAPLREAGYDAPFKTVEDGVHEYLDWLKTAGGS